MTKNSWNHKIVALIGLLVLMCSNLYALVPEGADTPRAAARKGTRPVATSVSRERNTQASTIYEYLFSFRHDDIITCADFSRDGRWLATGSELGTVLITDLESKKEITFKNPDSRDNGVQALRFSQDGQFLVVGGYGNQGGGGQIRILRTSDYTTAMSFDAPGNKTISYVDLTLDNKWVIATGASDVWVWNLENKRLAWQRAFKQAALRYDGKRALFITQSPTPALSSGEIALLSLVDGKVIRNLNTGIKEPIRRLVMAESKGELFALTDGPIVYRLNGSTGAVKQRISLRDLGLKVSPRGFFVWYYTDFEVLDNDSIFVFSDRQNTVLMNYASGKVLTLDHESQVGIKFNPGGGTFALLGGVKDGSLSGVPPQHYWTVSVFSFRPF
ncbi:MAG: WD40 repeat domain-containing protein [Acidobacteriota bacterium]